VIVGVIQKKTLAEVSVLLESVDTSLYAALELRLDACADLNLDVLGRIDFPLPVIFTLRCKEEGGAYTGSEAERLALLADLLQLKPDYVDIEASVAAEKIARICSVSPATKLILSQHDFKHTPASLEDMLEAMRNDMRESMPVIYKIATYAHSGLDALRMLVFCKEQSARGVSLIGICMGPDGSSTRILAPVVHTGFCYCPLAELSAPGQLDAATLRGLYNFASLDKHTAVYGLLGDPVEQSVGHLYHNERNAATRCNAVYVKWRIAKEELGQAMPLLRRLGVQGLSVTMPLKEVIMPFVAGMDSATEAIGAANTLKAVAGGFSATNTDGPGALAPYGEAALAPYGVAALAPDGDAALAAGGVAALEAEGLSDLRGKTVVLLGAGGAARAVMYEADKRGAKLVIYNRTLDKKLPNLSVKPEIQPFSSIGDLRELEYQIIINALPFGTPFAFEDIPFKSTALALDLSYGKTSSFLLAAKAAGCRTLDGSGMFKGQARLQRLFWGLPE
jgi:3-dehydroquinate dehydratase/shikimate dehydrogenase